MWEMPLIGVFLFQLLPLVIIIIIMLKIFKVLEEVSGKNYIRGLALIPYAGIFYYVITWIDRYNNPDTWAFSDGVFYPADVTTITRASTQFLLHEALPTCMALILLWGILLIIHHNTLEVRNR